MSKKKYSIEEITDIVENEGLGYAVQSYLSADQIADKKLAKEWAKAKETLDTIEGMLNVDW